MSPIEHSHLSNLSHISFHRLLKYKLTRVEIIINHENRVKNNGSYKINTHE